MSIKPKKNMSLKRQVAKTDHQQSGRLQARDQSPLTLWWPVMAIILIQIKQWKEEVNTVRHKHTLEAELFAQLLDNAEMFCLIWTPI